MKKTLASLPSDFMLLIDQTGRQINWVSYRKKMNRCKKLAIFTVVAGCCSVNLAQADSHITVTVQPWGAPVIETFDPNKPAEIPKEIAKGEAAVAINKTEVEANIRFQDTADGGMITKITSITVTGMTVIKLPNNAPVKLREHELGHDTLSKKEYENAEAKTKAAFAGLVGMTFKGNGTTPAQKQADAFKQAEAERDRRTARATKAIVVQAHSLGVKYDKVTDHGRGDGDGKQKDASGEIKKVKTSVGVAMALAQQAKAPKAGRQGFIPNLNSPFALAAATPLDIDPETSVISFSSPFGFTEALSPGDTILGNALLQIDPIQMVGLQANGTVLLADTTLQIKNSVGDFLMDAILFQLAFMPSSVDGFKSMIQGYLDVPPVFADGIDPGSSEFLKGMLESTNNGSLTMFYILFEGDIPIDAFGNFTTNSLVGTVLMATAVPLPATLWLFLSALGGLGLFNWRGRGNSS